MKKLILNILFPKRCVNCGKLGNYLCKICFSSVNINPQTICPMCGRLSVNGQTHPGCITRLALDGAVWAVEYTGAMRKFIKKFKYKPWVSDLAPFAVENFLIPAVSRQPALEAFLFENPLVVPIPLHFFRKLTRGFNQAGVLAYIFSQKRKLEFKPDLLIRVKNTQPQSLLKGEKRRVNVVGIFRFNSRYRQEIPYQALLVDDVWTTGATMRECAAVLKRAGVKEVWGLTLAG